MYADQGVCENAAADRTAVQWSLFQPAGDIIRCADIDYDTDACILYYRSETICKGVDSRGRKGLTVQTGPNCLQKDRKPLKMGAKACMPDGLRV